MVKGFHMGEFIKELLDEHKVKYAALAKEMGKSAQNVSDIFKRATVGDAVLMDLGKAARLDLIGMVRREQARLSGRELPPLNAVGDPAAVYGRRAAGMELVVNLEEYDEATQLKILRYIQQLPKRPD